MVGPAVDGRAARGPRRSGACSRRPDPEEKQPLDAAFFDLPERLFEKTAPCWTTSWPPAIGWRRRGPRRRAGHRRIVHGRPGAVRGLLPSLSQRACRGRPATAGPASTSRATTSITTPSAGLLDLLRATTVGDHRRQQERRHAGNGRRAAASSSTPCGSPAAATPRSCAAGSCPSPASRADCATWPRPWAAPRSFPFTTAWAGASRCSRRRACCRRP